MHELFEKVVKAFNEKDEKLFTAAAINWIDHAENNPFKEDSEERKLFFKAKQYCRRWRNGSIDMRSSKRNMVEMVHQIMEMSVSNPYPKEEIKEKKDIMKPKKEEIKSKETKNESKENEITKAQLKEDVNFLMVRMVDANNLKDNPSYEMYVNHLMEIATENPFKEDTKEYNLFAEMKNNYTSTPPNRRRTFVVGKQLCELINNTKVPSEKTEKQTVLGVIPDEKKSWLKFLFPWKKEDDKNDSP